VSIKNEIIKFSNNSWNSFGCGDYLPLEDRGMYKRGKFIENNKTASTPI
jgi:hypothetical protein